MGRELFVFLFLFLISSSCTEIKSSEDQDSTTPDSETATITPPSFLTPHDGASVTSTSVSLTGTCTTGLTLVLQGDFASSPLEEVCADNSFSLAVTLTSALGAKVIDAYQRDSDNNESTTVSLSLTVQAEDDPALNPDWVAVSSTRLLVSGHSLTDNPLVDYIEDTTDQTGDDYNYNQQIDLGSPIRVRTKGMDTGLATWPGYSRGKNKSTNNLDMVSEIRNPQYLGVGEKYDTLVITENHNSLEMIYWESTSSYLRHYQDTVISGNADTRTFFYHSWYSLDKTAPTTWIDYEKQSHQAWECVASQVNISLAAENRTDRIRNLPAAGALADLVERIVADELPEITGTTQAKLNQIFADNVHLTTVGAYYMSLVVYSAIYGKSPVGLNPPAGSGVSSSLATRFQTIAWNYIDAYYDRANPGVYSMAQCRSMISDNVCTPFYTLKNALGEGGNLATNITNCQNNFGGGSSPFSDNPLTVFPPAP